LIKRLVMNCKKLEKKKKKKKKKKKDSCSKNKDNSEP